MGSLFGTPKPPKIADPKPVRLFQPGDQRRALQQAARKKRQDRFGRGATQTATRQTTGGGTV